MYYYYIIVECSYISNALSKAYLPTHYSFTLHRLEAETAMLQHVLS